MYRDENINVINQKNSKQHLVCSGAFLWTQVTEFIAKPRLTQNIRFPFREFELSLINGRKIKNSLLVDAARSGPFLGEKYDESVYMAWYRSDYCVLQLFSLFLKYRFCLIGNKNGGEHGIRTHDTLTRIRPFQGRAFDHSANSPFVVIFLT